MDNTDRAKTVQKPCTHGLQNKKAMKSFDFTAFSGAMEGTRTPGLLIRSQQDALDIGYYSNSKIQAKTKWMPPL